VQRSPKFLPIGVIARVRRKRALDCGAEALCLTNPVARAVAISQLSHAINTGQLSEY